MNFSRRRVNVTQDSHCAGGHNWTPPLFFIRRDESKTDRASHLRKGAGAPLDPPPPAERQGGPLEFRRSPRFSPMLHGRWNTTVRRECSRKLEAYLSGCQISITAATSQQCAVLPMEYRGSKVSSSSHEGGAVTRNGGETLICQARCDTQRARERANTNEQREARSPEPRGAQGGGVKFSVCPDA